MLKRRWCFALLFAVAAPAPLLAQPAPAQAVAGPAEAEQDKAADAEQKKREAQEKRAAEEKAAKAKRDQLMSKCQIKPVMSDDDIANCRAAFAAN